LTDYGFFLLLLKKRKQEEEEKTGDIFFPCTFFFYYFSSSFPSRFSRQRSQARERKMIYLSSRKLRFFLAGTIGILAFTHTHATVGQIVLALNLEKMISHQRSVRICELD
jgi:hypothetical protein